jgi:hypothetical protein
MLARLVDREPEPGANERGEAAVADRRVECRRRELRERGGRGGGELARKGEAARAMVSGRGQEEGGA